MPRTTPPDRLSKLLAAAAAAFIEHGFQRTQMDDIAERLGLSKGTIYRSVDSKEALFAAVITWADTPHRALPASLTPSIDTATVAATIAHELTEAVTSLELATIVGTRQRLRAGDEIGSQIERLAVDLHRVMQSRRTAIMVLDRCAPEIPELAAVWFGDGRYALVDLWHDYLTLRSNQLTTAVDRAILARTIVEILTTWAVKMPWDPSPRPYTDDNAASCAAMIRNLVTGPA